MKNDGNFFKKVSQKYGKKPEKNTQKIQVNSLGIFRKKNPKKLKKNSQKFRKKIRKNSSNLQPKRAP